MVEFSVRAVARLRDGELKADVLVLAEHEDGSGRRLELRRSLEVSERDRRRGMDTYALVTETGTVHYGGIRTWSLVSNRLELNLTETAAADLRARGGYRLTLAEPGVQSAVVVAGVAEIMGVDTSPVMPPVLEMLERARKLAGDALAERERSGEELTPRTPPAVALRVLDDLITRVRDGSVGPRAHRLGLSRGAGDLEWLPTEQPLIDLFFQIDEYWQARVWDRAPPR